MTARHAKRGALIGVLVAAGLAPVALSRVEGTDSGPQARPAVAPVRIAAPAPCRRYASPRGSDHASGSRRHPFRSAHRLARSLRHDQTGCLVPGLYTHRGVARLRAPGSALRGIGKGSARVRGPIWITPGATGASVSRLVMSSRDPVYSTPLKVQADHAHVFDNRIFGSENTSCVILASQGEANGIVLERNRISHCGRIGKFDHLIYAEQTRDLVIRDNVLTGNTGGWAIHLYPDADRTLVEHNVIDGNTGGVIFAGDGEGAHSDDNMVRGNVISYSGPRWNVEGSWGDGPQGTGNLAESNCLISTGPGAPSGLGAADGFMALVNQVLTRSPYVARTRGNYRLKKRSPCRALAGDPASGLRRPAR